MMPDIHAGAGCTIGTTMTIKDKICPNLVGVDIGCGMETIRIKETHIEPQKLDKVIRAGVPSGFEIRTEAHRYGNPHIHTKSLRAGGNNMNIVFWLIVVIVLVLIWFCLSFAFKGVGGVGMRLYNDAKKEISEETEKKTDEEKEVKE